MSYGTLIIGVSVALLTFVISVLNERVEEGKWDKPLERAVILAAFAMLLWTAYSEVSGFLHRKNSTDQFQSLFHSTDSLLHSADSLELELKERSQTVDSLRRVSRNQKKDLEQLSSSTRASSRLISGLSAKQRRLVEKADSLRRKANRLKSELDSRASVVQIMTVISASSGFVTPFGSKSRAERNPWMGEVRNEAAFVDEGLWPMYAPHLDPANDGDEIDLCHLRMEQADERLKWAAIAMAKDMHSDTEKFPMPRLLLFEPCEDTRHFGQSGFSSLAGRSLYLYSDVPVLKRIVKGDAKGVELGFVVRINNDLTYYQMQGNLNSILDKSLQYASDWIARKQRQKNCLERYEGNAENLSIKARNRVFADCGIDKIDIREEVEKKRHMTKLATDTSAVVVPLRMFDRTETSVDTLTQIATIPPYQETRFDAVSMLSGQSFTRPQKKMWDLRRSFTFRGSKTDVGVDPVKISYFGIGEGQATYYDALSDTEYRFPTKYFYDYACNTDTALPEILDEVTPERNRASQWMTTDINDDMGLDQLSFRKGKYVRLNDFLKELEDSEAKKLYSEAVCKDSQEHFGYVNNREEPR